MIWLVLGLLLWSGAHLMKRVAPGVRQSLQDRFGDGSKGIVAVASLAGIVLMVIGYRGWYADMAYEPPSWGIHLNNLLMLIAVILLGLGNSKSRFRGARRHPMLAGVIVFAIAHLLVNGDWASVVLFGGLGLWAMAEIVLINRAVPDWERPAPGTLAGDIKLLAISAVVFAVIAGIHFWLGYPVFPG